MDMTRLPTEAAPESFPRCIELCGQLSVFSRDLRSPNAQIRLGQFVRKLAALQPVL